MRRWTASVGRMAADPERLYTIEFYDDPETGAQPVVAWMRSLTWYQRRAIGVALTEVLQRHGIDVCATEWGKQLGDGLFEFRVRHDAGEIIAMFTNKEPDNEPDEARLALRVFCHAHGDRLVLLCAGYDKAADPSEKREDREIALARRRLREYRQRGP